MAALLWIVHGYLLYRGWGKFRPHIALLHGVLIGVLGLGLQWLNMPLWALLGAGVAVGGVGALGHALVPGLWLGAIIGPAPFTLGAQVGALAVGLVKRPRLG